MYSLTERAINRIMNGEEVDKPVIQILSHKPLSRRGDAERRYRLLISDGKEFNSWTMLASELNHLITGGTMTEFSICQINQYTVCVVNNNSRQQKRVLVILGIEILTPGSEVNEPIGNPTQFEGIQPKPESENF